MMPFTRPQTKQPVIVAVLLDVLEEVPTHFRKDRGGTVACLPGACPHCRDGFVPAAKWYGPAALVQETGTVQADLALEDQIAALRASLPASMVERERQAARCQPLLDELARLVARRAPPVKSWSLIPYASRSGRFLPSLVVAEVGDMADLPNESGAVLRWERKGHTRVTFCGLMPGELPVPFDWRTGLAKLIGQWWDDEAVEQPDTIRFPGRKIG